MIHPEPSPNRYRTVLYSGDLPDGDLSPRQRAIVDAVKHTHALVDFSMAPASLSTNIVVCNISHGTSESVADRAVREGLDRAERELLRLRAVYKAYGASAFMPRSQPMNDRTRDAKTRKEALVKMIEAARAQGCVLTRAGTQEIHITENGYEVSAPANEP